MGPVLVIIGVITIIATLGIQAQSALFIAALAVVGGLWYISLQIWPEKKCSRCNGQGSHGPFSLRRSCRNCEGSGRVPRIGAS